MAFLRFVPLAVILLLHGCVTVPRHPAQAPFAGQGVCLIVQKGQTLYSISKLYNVSISELMRINNIADPGQIAVGQRLYIPPAPGMLPPAVGLATTQPIEDLVGPKQYRVRWKTITLHHSGTPTGDAASFGRNHRRRGMGGLFYHFVIGNGNGSQDGEVEVGWRWKKQREVNRRGDIQICLVGNFDNQAPTQRQLGSLVQLLRVLTVQYSIPLCDIRRHKDVRGRPTECPGINFPFDDIILSLRK